MSKRRFEFVDDQSKKFWEVEVAGVQMTVCFGRIGTAGSAKTKSFGSAAEAEREASKSIAEKTKKGYVEVTEGGPGGAAASPAPAGEKSEATRATNVGDVGSLETVFAALDRALGLAANTQNVDLELLTELLGRAPHVELRALWKWGHAADVLGHELLSVAREERDDWWWGAERWNSPLEVASELNMLREIPTFPKTLVPIADDGAGNQTCFDLETGALVDWDHETREASRRSGNLQKIFETALKLVNQERRARDRAATEASAAAQRKEAKPTSLPKKLRPLPSQLVRSLNAHYRSSGFSNAAITTDGTLLVGWVSGKHELAFVDLAKGTKDLIPDEPEFTAYLKKYNETFAPPMHAAGIVIDKDRFAWLGLQKHRQLTIWSWKDGVLSMERGGTSTEGAFETDSQPRLRGPWLVTRQSGPDNFSSTSLALWSTDELPRVSSFAEAKTSTVAPKAMRKEPVRKVARVVFDVDASGNVVYANEISYQRWTFTYWEASTTNRVREIELPDVEDVVVTADGERIFVLMNHERSGELRVYDRDLTLKERIPAHEGWQLKALRLSQAEEVFVTWAENGDTSQFWLWNAKTLEVLGKTKAAKHPRTLGVGTTTMVTTDPIALYELC